VKEKVSTICEIRPLPAIAEAQYNYGIALHRMGKDAKRWCR
jgi:hypothetical protein